ncbi:MAG: ankyrin repeat domain-containing protein [Sandaracinaceae bacterium]|nr:ankyrin repeat domain-containing protein [Sandaracinaceae bacterium]
MIVPEAQMSLHEACYRGRLARVKQLLDEGADPNAPANPDERPWVSSAGKAPRPLNCIAIAHSLTEDHVEIARLLIARGGRVDHTVLRDHDVEMLDRKLDRALRQVLLAASTS